MLLTWRQLIFNIIYRQVQKLEEEVQSLRENLSQATMLKEELGNEAYQLREKFQEEVSSYVVCVAFTC